MLALWDIGQRVPSLGEEGAGWPSWDATLCVNLLAFSSAPPAAPGLRGSGRPPRALAVSSLPPLKSQADPNSRPLLSAWLVSLHYVTGMSLVLFLGPPAGPPYLIASSTRSGFPLLPRASPADRLRQEPVCQDSSVGSSFPGHLSPGRGAIGHTPQRAPSEVKGPASFLSGRPNSTCCRGPSCGFSHSAGPSVQFVAIDVPDNPASHESSSQGTAFWGKREVGCPSQAPAKSQVSPRARKPTTAHSHRRLRKRLAWQTALYACSFNPPRRVTRKAPPRPRVQTRTRNHSKRQHLPDQAEQLGLGRSGVLIQIVNIRSCYA